MGSRFVAKQARPKQTHTSDTLDAVLAERAWHDAADHRAGVGSASGAHGHDFGRVAIYHPAGQGDLAAEEQARVAESGLQGPSTPFPFRERIEGSFGRPIPAQAHTDHKAADACGAL